MKYVLIALLGITLFAACTKVDSPASREEELRNGRWHRSGLKIKYDPYIGDDKLEDYYANSLPDCKKDNYIVFGINHDALLRSGDNRCSDVPDPDNVAFYWSLENNKNRITLLNANDMFFDSSTIDAKFEKYSNNQFEISYVEYQPNAFNMTKKDTITYYFTFTKF